MKFKNHKSLLSFVLVACLLITSTASVFAQVTSNSLNSSVINVWDGYQSEDDAVSFDGGNGTLTNPYLISNGDQLHKMVSTSGQDGNSAAYYKLTADIYLNDISNFDEWSQDGFDFSTLNNWASELASRQFVGTVNGDGYTIYGMYAEGACAGFIPYIGVGTTTIKNLNIDKFYARSTGGGSGAGAAALIGRASFNNQECQAVITKCAVTNGTATGAYSAAVLAYRYQSPLTLTNTLVADVTLECTIDKAGIFADGWTTNATVSSCLFIGLNPLGTRTNSVAAYSGTNDVYTDTDFLKCSNSTNEDYIKDHNNSKTIQIVPNSYFIGENAAYMLDIDWDNWITTDKYPHPDVKRGVNIDVSDVWNGTASKWTTGSGTASDPYLVENAEQLAYFAENYCTGTKKYYALTNDIYLNDISSDAWEEESGLNNWIVCSDIFSGEFDGRGHVIYGMYYNYEEVTNSPVRIGFIGQVGAGAVIKNLGFSYSKIYGNSASGNNFTGGIVGFISNWASGDKLPSDAEDGSVIVNGVSKQVPVIENCFIDHNSKISGYYIGGIVGAASSAVIAKNCFATCKLDSTASSSFYGAIIGDAWINGSVVINCFSSTHNADPFCSGGAFTSNPSNEKSLIKGSYTFSFAVRSGVNNIKLVEDRLGEKGREIMAKTADNPDGLDFDNIWQAVDGGTPVLKAFINDSRTADEFSYKDYRSPGVTLTLDTGDSSVVCEPITRGMYSAVVLPVPKREGYDFVGWYIYYDNSYNYECYQCEYDYGYMPPRDLTLYAKWEQSTIYQDFEDFPNTDYDMDMSKWKYNKYSVLGSLDGYYSDYARGSKSSSMHRLNTDGESDCVLNYKDSLDVGRTYEMTFWVTTDESTASATLSLVHNTWPDYLDPIDSLETITSLDNIQKKQWVECKYKFTAKTPWVSLRTTGGASLYFDDISFVACETDESFSYSITSGEVEITGITSSFEGELNIPSSLSGCAVTKIAAGAFNSHSGITSVTIPDSIISIGSGAFYNCANLESISVDEANTSYASVDGVLFSQDKTELIKYPPKKADASYSIPEGTTTVYIDAFNGCESLKDITIAASVSSIDNYAIICNNNLESITVAENNSVYNSNNNCNAIIETATNTLIAGCKNTVIPDGVTAINGGAFYGCESVEQIAIPESVVTIGDTAFNGCANAVIVCKKNSAAYNYAVEKGINYLFFSDKIPVAPIVTRVTEDSIILMKMTGYEYSIDGVNWQDTNIFENLQSGTEYTVYQRYAQSGNKAASAKSVGVKATTKGVTALDGWVLQSGKWYYYRNNAALTGWQSLGEWYYFNASGEMATGWLNLGGTWYYMGTSGAMVTGWQVIGGSWYYFNSSGAMATGWLNLGGTWYYMGTSGAMVTGWQVIGGTWYYFNASGAMATGWQQIGGTWYYFKSSGAMATGWLNLGGTWYYMGTSGAMVTGWQVIGGSWYYFYDNGAMAANCYVGSYWINANGVWVA